MKQEDSFSVEEILAEFGGKPDAPQEPVDVDALVRELLDAEKPPEPEPTPEPEPEPTPEPEPEPTPEPEPEPMPEPEPEPEPDVPRMETSSDEPSDQPEDFAIDTEKIRRAVHNAHASDAGRAARSAHTAEEETPSDASTLQETAEQVSRRLRQSNRTLTLMLLLTLPALALEGLNRFWSGLPAVLSKTESPLVYCGVSLAFLLLAMLVSCRTLLDGVRALFTLRPNKNALPAVAAIAALVQAVALLFLPDAFQNPSVHLYSSIAVTGLLVHAWGNRMLASAARSSFKVVSSKYRKCGVQIMDEQDALSYLRGLPAGYPTLLVNRQMQGVSRFTERLNAPDSTDAVGRILAPLVLGVSILVGAAVGVTVGDFAVAVTVFAATGCICAPFSYILASAVPQKKISDTLFRLGAAMLGAGDAEDYSETNALVLDAATLFPEDSVTLHGIKTFGGARIDDAILDAASVACAGNSILTGLFTQILSGKDNLLRPVQNLTYEDGLGQSAWVENKRVLIGTRELMRNYGVDVPSKDYETRYLNAGNELVYLSTGGELAAVFVIELHAAPETVYALRMLEYRDVALVVNTADAMVTVEKLEALFDVNREMLKILPARLQPHYAEATAPVETASASLLDNGTVYSTVSAVCEAKRLKSTLMLMTVIQLASALTGLAIITLFVFVRDFSQLSAYMLFVYQMMWLVLSWLVARLK